MSDLSDAVEIVVFVKGGASTKPLRCKAAVDRWRNRTRFE